MRNVRRAAVLVFSSLFLLPVMAAEQPAKEARVRELLVLMRAGDLGVQVVDNMIGTMKQMAPDAPEDFWTSFRSRVKASDLVDLLVPVYANNLEAADVEELIRFFSSPAGQRFLARQGTIMEQSMAVGQQWGEKIAADAIAELQKRNKSE